jgi:NADH-quinone oxidoreductase subunit M
MIQFLLLLPLFGALSVLLFGLTPRTAFVLAFGFSLLSLALAAAAFLRYQSNAISAQAYDVQATWIPQLHVDLHFGYDGMSLLFVLLTSILTPVSLLVAAFTVHERVNLYMSMVLFLQGALIGVFLALDLAVFYVFWEAVLIPAYFMIGLWGGERRVYAAFKYLIYTMVGSLLMLVGILLLYAESTTHTFDLLVLTTHPLTGDLGRVVFVAFALAFGIKAAVFPFHSWVPDVYTQSTPSTAIILAGVLSKMGIYGFLRLCLPLFPDASRYFGPAIMVLAVIGIIYGALMALQQTEMMRLIACSSIAHLGFITLGIFSLTTQGIQGATLQSLNHGITIGALFAVAAVIGVRWGTTDLGRLGGLADRAPVIAAVFLVVTLSALGLPGLNGFAGEILILTGTFRVNAADAVIGAAGVVLAAAYMLRLFQGAEHGPTGPAAGAGAAALPSTSYAQGWSELSVAQYSALIPLIVLMVWIGVAPGGWLDPTLKFAQSLVQVVGGRP